MSDLEYTVSSLFASIRSKEYWIDTTARMSFYIPLVGAWEKFVAGYENDELLRSRATAVVLNLGLGYAHRKARQYVSGLLHVDEQSSAVRKGAANVLASVGVGATSYAVILTIARPSLQEALVAGLFALGLGVASGEPYGRFHDWYRGMFGLRPIHYAGPEPAA